MSDHPASGPPGSGHPSAVHFEIQVPEGSESGVYANFLSVWHADHDFTLDFCVTDQPRGNDDGSVTVACRVAARVKIPLTVAEDMLRALADNVSRYEQVAGRIRKPGEDLDRPSPGETGMPEGL